MPPSTIIHQSIPWLGGYPEDQPQAPDAIEVLVSPNLQPPPLPPDATEALADIQEANQKESRIRFREFL